VGQPGGVNVVNYPQTSPPAQAADQPPRKAPRIYLFMGFGF
jgi:hypothetical protein